MQRGAALVLLVSVLDFAIPCGWAAGEFIPGPKAAFAVTVPGGPSHDGCPDVSLAGDLRDTFESTRECSVIVTRNDTVSSRHARWWQSKPQRTLMP